MIKKSSYRCCVLDAATTLSTDLNLDALGALLSVQVYDRTPPERTVERAQGCEVVITNKVVLNREILAQLPDLQAVFLMSTGTNVVDGDACSERGIPVCNIPAYSTSSVAELVFAFLFDWARGVSRHAASVREGDWARHEDFCYTLTPQRELAGVTLGLIGFGEIAQSVARIARAFGLQVFAVTPHPEGKPDLGQRFVSMEHLLRDADVVSLHCPLNEDTQMLINESRLSLMKPGSVLINTSRGGLVDEEALASALERGPVSAAYLDVLSAEPPPASHSLTARSDTRITPHLAWATRSARERLLEVLVANVEAWIEGRTQNQVNAQ